MDFSFIIPVYNCKPYLESCVNSIIAADLPSYEIILVDDGSKDGSSQLCDELSMQHPQIKVIHQQNSGASSARNTGLQASSGTYLLFTDADDTYESELLGSILHDSRIDETELTIFGLSFDYYYRKKCYRRDPLFIDSDIIWEHGYWSENLKKLFDANSISPLWNKVFLRRIIINHNLKLNSSMFLYEDLEFVLRYLACCNNIRNVPKAVYHYRQTEDEGNAGRRLARIDSIPDFLIPIENALHDLREKHPGIDKSECDSILQSLHLTLAREKITVSSPAGIRKICIDYAQWEAAHISSPDPSRFRNQLQNKQVFRLWTQDKLTAIRHRIAVIVKSALYQLRKEAKENA